MVELTKYRYSALKRQLENNQLALSEVTVDHFHQLMVRDETQQQALVVLGQQYLVRTLNTLNQKMDQLEFDRAVFERMDSELDGIVYLDGNNKIHYDFVKAGRFFTNYFKSMVDLSKGVPKLNFGMIMMNLLFLPKNAWLFGENYVIKRTIKDMRRKYIEGKCDDGKYCIPEHIGSGIQELVDNLKDNNKCKTFAPFTMEEYIDMGIYNVTGLANIFEEYRMDSEVLKDLFRHRNERYYR